MCRKHLLRCFAVIFMVLLALAASAGVAQEIKTDASGHWEYILENDSATIVSWVKDRDAEEITIPSELDGYIVTRINKGAFQSSTTSTRVVIPSSVTSIEANPFDYYFCMSLVFIDVSEGNPRYEQIDGVLFDKQEKILVAYPAGKEGEAYAIPEGTLHIGESAFSHCASLMSITVPDSVTSIGKEAFESCNDLINMAIPYGVESIDDDTFRGCLSLEEVVIPGSVTRIGKSAFAHCRALADIEIPDGVVCIEQDAFYDCEELTRVSIPASVTEIAANPFTSHHPSSLTYIDVSTDNPRYAQIEGVLFDKELHTLLVYPAGRSGAYAVPEGVQHIGNGAFEACISLTSVTLPDSVTSIGNAAFESCWALKSVSIPEGVTHIGYGSFSGCSSLTRLEIPASVTSIEVLHYSPGEPTGTGLLFIDVSPDNPSYKQIDGVLFDKLGKTLISYPSGRKDAYEMPETVEYISEHAFSTSFLVSLTIPDGVKSIGDMAFDYGWDLISVTIPSSVTDISKSAFDFCNELTLSVTQGSFAEQYAEENNIPFVIVAE